MNDLWGRLQPAPNQQMTRAGGTPVLDDVVRTALHRLVINVPINLPAEDLLARADEIELEDCSTSSASAMRYRLAAGLKGAAGGVELLRCYEAQIREDVQGFVSIRPCMTAGRLLPGEAIDLDTATVEQIIDELDRCGALPGRNAAWLKTCHREAVSHRAA